MPEFDTEKIEAMMKALQTGADLSTWQKNSADALLLALLSDLDTMPKAKLPAVNLSRVRNQVLDRISVPAVASERSWFAAILPTILKIGISAIASILIVMSLSLGTAVAAINSLPGQPIYPLKKVVENIQLQLASPDQRASLQLKFADNRIDELQQVLAQNQQGKISNQDTQKIVAQTVQDFQKSTADAVKSAAEQPMVVSTLTDLSNKLQAASVQSEGTVKIELEQAVQATQISQQQAIQNIENAGLKVENPPITIVNTVTASGKITEVAKDSVTVGAVKFLLTKDTQYFGLQPEGLQIGTVVDIEGETKDNQTYADKVTLIANTEKTDGTSSGATTQTQTPPSNPDLIVIPDNQ